MRTGKLLSAGVVSAIAASLCCITPVLALIAGSGSAAASFSWIEPARPYFIGFTLLILGWSWYLKLKPDSTDACGCSVHERPRWFKSKTFLLLVTLFTGLMIAFPYYAKFFYPQTQKARTGVEKSNTQVTEVSIRGMTCEACEEIVQYNVNKLPGIIQTTVSYEKQKAIIKFDSSKTTIADITNAINSTGYEVIHQTLTQEQL